MFSTSATCRLNDLRKPLSRRRSVSCDLANVNKQIAEFPSTIRVAWSLQTMCLTSATCRLRDLRKLAAAAEPPRSAAELPSAATVSRHRQLQSRHHQPRSRYLQSISGELANVNKRKLRTFDGPLGLPGHCRRDFDVDDVSYRQKMMVRVRDNCHCLWSWSMSPPSSFRNFVENPQFCTFVSPSSLCNSISHFVLYQHPPPKWTAMKNQKLTPQP